MSDDPVAELEALLEVGDDDVVQWWESGRFKPDSASWTAAREDCVRRYQEAFSLIADSWGQPDSSGTVTVDEGELVVPDLYPSSICEFVEEVAIWDCDGHVACVWWGLLEDRKSFEVCVGVAGREE